jgi:isopentenyl phosphate kinase
MMRFVNLFWMTQSYIVKLGGSLITDKNTQDTFDQKGIKSCIDWLSMNKENVRMIVIGGGSFGHIAAKKLQSSWKNISLQDKKKQIQAIQDSMQVLYEHLKNALLERGIETISVSPCDYESLSKAVDRCVAVMQSGSILLTHGDVMPNTDTLTIVSSEDMMLQSVCHGAISAEAKKNYQYVFFTKTKGVLDSDGNIIPVIKSESVIETFGTANDTTGGMKQKLANAFTLAETGNEVWITHPSIFADGGGTSIVREGFFLV